ncbi:unnamed protein product [Lymnaea stagnalis]|uniref:CARD domain-containing protein n=1 Tax=Lymnaea stagnalis TaxID=6523 RepID=A0AAV2I0W7_LYMST
MDRDQTRRHRPETRAAELDESHWRRRSSAKLKSKKNSAVKGQENPPNKSRRTSSQNNEEAPQRSVSRFDFVPSERADSISHQLQNPDDDTGERETSDSGSVPRLGINGDVSNAPDVERRKGSVEERVTNHKGEDRDSISDNSIIERQEGVPESCSRNEDNGHAVKTSHNVAAGHKSQADGHTFRETGGGHDLYSTESNRLLNSTSVSIDKNEPVPLNISRLRRDRYFPGNGALSTGMSYFHGDIVDDNLMISNSKLDNALLKMFSSQPSCNETSHSFAAPSLTHDLSDDIGMAPVMWRVHPMEAVHRETLDRETGFLADHLTPRDMIGDLYRQNVLTSADYNQLSRMEGQGDRAVTRLMVKTLQRRGHNAYPAFLNVLRQHGFHNVCERLMESERSLKNGIQQDRSSYDRVKDWVNFERITPNGLRTSFSFNRGYSPLSTDFNPYSIYHTTHVTPGYQLPLAYHMPLNLPLTPPTYPLATNHVGSFPSRLTTPQPREPIIFSQLETQLEFMRKELKALHYDVFDMKSALRNNGPSATPDTSKRPSEGDRAAVKHEYPEHGSRPHSPASGDSSVHSPTPDSSRPVRRLNGSPRPGEGEKSFKIIEAEGLSKHLGELHAEVKALHDDVTALTTSRSRKDWRSFKLHLTPNARTPDDDGSQFSINQTSLTPRQIHRNETIPDNETPVKDLDYTQRITHRDYDPLPNPTPLSLVPERNNSLGGEGRDNVMAPSSNHSSKTTIFPSRKTHESFDPLPREDKTVQYRLPSWYSAPVGLNDVDSPNPALPNSRSSKRQTTVKEYSSAGPPSLAAIKQKVRDETTGYYGVEPPPPPQDASSNHEAAAKPSRDVNKQNNNAHSRISKPITSSVQGRNLHGSKLNFQGSSFKSSAETRGDILDQSVEDLQGRVRELAVEIATLKAQRNGQSVTPTRQHNTPTDQDSHARKLEEQLEELHAQLRRLRNDVTDLKTDNQLVNKTNPETKGILKPTKSSSSPQYLSPNPHPTPTSQARPVTKQESRDKAKPADDRKSSNFLNPESPESQASIRRSSNDSFRASSSNGARITTESRVLSPPSDRDARVRRITSPLTILPDQSLPWPESTRVKVAT